MGSDALIHPTKKIIIFKNPSFTHTSPKEKLLPKGTDLGGLVSQTAMPYGLHKLREKD